MLGESSKKRRILLFFFIIVLIVASSVIHIMTAPPALDKSSAKIRNAESRKEPLHLDRLVLVKGKKQMLGSLQIIYRGIEADTILIDVTLFDLDPEYAYRHRISLELAKQGFQMADQKFQLVSATPSRLKIALNKG